MMQVQSSNLIKRGVLGFSHFCEREWRLSGVTGCRISSQLPCLDRHDSPAPSLRSRMISSQTVVKVRSNEAVQEKSWGLSHSGSYDQAMEALSSLITRKRGEKSAVGSKYSKLERMMMYLKILGLEEKVAGLRIIHVAGTKGKGSTCAFSEAILRECGFRTGLFTSPHLIDVRERFRIDGVDISEEKFLKYFWDCWDQLKDKVMEELPMPPLFQFLTLLAFKIFTYEKVDVGIFEVGLGGRNDSTNVIREPVVCGIASLGMDHMETLGNTLGEIASHKAGILKPNTPAFTVHQLPEAMDVITETAQQVGAPLDVVSPLNSGELNGIQLSLAGDHQFVNAALAVSLCRSWIQRTGNWEKLSSDDENEAGLPDAFLRGLTSARLSGRAQIVYDTISKSSSSPSGDLVFYLDGAHSPESMDACARWFSKAVKGHDNSVPLSSFHSSFADELTEAVYQSGFVNSEKGDSDDKVLKQVLLFNCMDVRNPQLLLPKLACTCASAGVHFSKALFVPSMSTYNKVISGSSVSSLSVPARDISWQYRLRRIWEKTINGNDFDVDKNSEMDCLDTWSTDALPPVGVFHENHSHNSCGDYHPSSAVIPSLPLAIKWLRDCVKENPSLKLQVLVTGSLHLVGDVLRLLKR